MCNTEDYCSLHSIGCLIRNTRIRVWRNYSRTHYHIFLILSFSWFSSKFYQCFRSLEFYFKTFPPRWDRGQEKISCDTFFRLNTSIMSTSKTHYFQVLQYQFYQCQTEDRIYKGIKWHTWRCQRKITCDSLEISTYSMRKSV